MKKYILKALFSENVDILWKHINRNEISEISLSYDNFLREKDTFAEHNEFSGMVKFFTTFIETKYNTVDNLKKMFNEFNSGYFKSDTDAERNSILLKFANSFGKTTVRKRKQDSKALKRFFDKDAATERYQKYSMSLKKQISAFFRCLTAVLINIKASNISKSDIDILLNTIFNALKKEKVPRIRIDILACVANLIKNIPEIKENIMARENELSLLLKILSDPQSNTWVKCEVLNILALLRHKSLQTNIKKMLDAKYNDDIFVRRHSVKLLIDNVSFFTDKDKLLFEIIKDSSAFVRQQLAESLNILQGELSVDKFYFSLLLKESDIAVQCSTLKNISTLISIGYPVVKLISPYQKLLLSNSNPKLIEFGLLNLADCFDAIKDEDIQNRELWLEKFHPIIEQLHCNAENVTTRRIAAQTRELLWCKSTPEAQQLLKLIKKKTESLKLGKSAKLLHSEVGDFNDMTIGRVLAVVSQNDCSLELKRSKLSYQLIRNYRFGFKWWRLIHEFRHPSPDKRQTFSHTRGRLFRGEIRSATSIMAELSETKVPGEPLFISNEGNSRPYLPLPDEIISASETSQTIKVFTPEGVTSIKPPQKFYKRLLADIKLAFNFKKYAALRNWQEGFQKSPAEYISAVKKLGFDINITPYPKSKFSIPEVDPKVKRFFSIQFLLPLYLSNFYNSLKVYFLSLYQNTITQLAVFVAALLAIFFGRHLTINALIRKSRAAIPLVIGGWGTRGKSGTERIKAALFASLGCSVISKTTGCEAMFLYTPPFEKTHELFLFRPYDKATIWEQFNIFRLADKLNADVFLWECMALAPTYVRILQKHWMKDNFSTITNTYPDHEDIQGPAGWNIAETMTNFVPTNGNLVTAEEQLFPFLETAAKYKNTKFARVDWKDAILIPADILERFPYEEHPHNIAMVLKLVENLGIEKEFALKEMADNVIPDIGVLKKYPTAKVRSRKLEFISGMSANERFGCMQNWTRMRLDITCPEENPDVWITTVVNNRADRIARSRAFAKILVEDLSVDRHFLIGSNLKGMLGYIKEAWDTSLAEFTLWNENNSKEHALEQFNIKSDFLRIPKTEVHLKRFLAVMLKSSENQDNDKLIALFDSPDKLATTLKSSGKYLYSDEIVDHYNKYHSLYIEYSEFIKKLSNPIQHAELNKTCKSLLWKWFEQKLIVIHNYSATGNQVVEIVAKSTPPGVCNKIMALQNIKGTGLDFFYRWQAWENCYNLCQNIVAAQDEKLEGALRELAKINSFGILTLDTVAEMVSNLIESKNNPDSVNIMLKELKEKLDRSALINSNISPESKCRSSNINLLFKLVENFLDPGDSVRRRKKVDRIYRDLAKGRVSYSLAIMTLQKINKKQKGGWLKLK
jgi:gamma-polyglutamate synthase